jgi:hypothetical protein
MPVLPWTTTDEAHGDDVVVLASRLHLSRLRDVPGFLRAALGIRRQVLGSAGAVGVSLLAQPATRTFWTLSAWTDDDAISRFVGEQPHRDVMAKYHERLEDAQFTTWSTSASALPAARSNARDLWTEGRARLATTLAPGEGE